MPIFAYTGRDAQGSLVEGELESESSYTLANHLISAYITPINITAVNVISGKQSNTTASTSLPKFDLADIQIFQEKIQTNDLMMFSRKIYTMLKAGIPIISALNGLQASTANCRFAQVIGDLNLSLNNGVPLSTALSVHETIFSSFYINMIRVGESTGMLETIFLRLSDHLQFEKFMRDQIK